MRTRAFQIPAWLSVYLMLVAAPLAYAKQEQQPQQPEPPSQPQSSDQSSGPIPAYRSPLASAAGEDQSDDENQELAPDNRSLSGAQNLSLGISPTRNYWQPRLDVSATADSNALETAQSSGWGSWVAVSGGVDISRTSGLNVASLNYTFGELFSNYTGVNNGVLQGLSVADKLSFKRFSISFFDDLDYLPEQPLGFWANKGGSVLPIGGPFSTGQSILSGQGRNLGDSFAGEVDTFLTSRSSLTLVGGYTLLHYFESGLLDFDGFNFRVGYNYLLTRKDTFSVLYTFGGFRYSNYQQSIDSHTAQVSYGRRVTGRLAFQVAAGPQILISHLPITGGNGSLSGVGVGSNYTRIYWSLNSALSWESGRTRLGLSYNHGATGGSGILAGAITDVATGSATRQVSRTFSNGINVGYARNKGLIDTNPTPTSRIYNYWFVGASLAHPMGRAMGLTLSYQMQNQDSYATSCLGPSCGTDVIRHVITVGVGWHEHPLAF